VSGVRNQPGASSERKMAIPRLIDAEDQCEGRCDEHPVDKRRSSEDLRHGVPNGAAEESEPERLNRLFGGDEQDGRNQGEQAEDGEGDNRGKGLKDEISRGGDEASLRTASGSPKWVHGRFNRRTVLSYVAFAH